MYSLPTIYVGYDRRDKEAYKVLVESILDRTSHPVNIIPIYQEEMRRIGFYRRTHRIGKDLVYVGKSRYHGSI